MNQKLTEELKPCPFCGRKPKVIRDREIHFAWTGSPLTAYQAYCPFKTCLVQPMTEWREKKQDCIADWNTRNEVKNG